MTVEVDVAQAYHEIVDSEFVERAAFCVLAAERAEGDVTIIITDDDAVAELNERFLGREGPTDVLSFPAQEEESEFVLPPEEAATPYLGDVIIALPFTERQARRLGRPLRDELALLVVHGILHLLGYEHATPEQKAEMWQKQDAILSGLGVSPSLE